MQEGGATTILARKDFPRKKHERSDPERRSSAFISLWRQRLTIALQKEGQRILKRKVEACLGDAPYWVNWCMDEGPLVDAVNQ